MKNNLLRLMKLAAPIAASVVLCAIAFGVVSKADSPIADLGVVPAEAAHTIGETKQSFYGKEVPAVTTAAGTVVKCQSFQALLEYRRYAADEVASSFVKWEGLHHGICDGTGDPGDLIIVFGELIDGSTGLSLFVTPEFSCAITNGTPCPVPWTTSTSTYSASPLGVYAVTHIKVYDASTNQVYCLYGTNPSICDSDPHTECYKPGDHKFKSNARSEVGTIVTPIDYQENIIMGTVANGWAFSSWWLSIMGKQPDSSVPNGQLEVTVKATKGSAPAIALMYAGGVGEDNDLTSDTSGGTISEGQTVVLFGTPNAPWPYGQDSAHYAIKTGWSGPVLVDLEIVKVRWLYTDAGVNKALVLYP